MAVECGGDLKLRSIEILELQADAVGQLVRGAMRVVEVFGFESWRCQFFYLFR